MSLKPEDINELFRVDIFKNQSLKFEQDFKFIAPPPIIWDDEVKREREQKERWFRILWMILRKIGPVRFTRDEFAREGFPATAEIEEAGIGHNRLESIEVRAVKKGYEGIGEDVPESWRELREKAVAEAMAEREKIVEPEDEIPF